MLRRQQDIISAEMPSRCRQASHCSDCCGRLPRRHSMAIQVPASLPAAGLVIDPCQPCAAGSCWHIGQTDCTGHCVSGSLCLPFRSSWLLAECAARPDVVTRSGTACRKCTQRFKTECAARLGNTAAGGHRMLRIQRCPHAGICCPQDD